MITLKTLATASPQQVYDQIVNHLRKQGEKSFEDEICQYRTSNGLKCAAGCLIADDEYSSEFEGCIWTDLIDQMNIESAHSTLISELQVVHDLMKVENWEENFIHVAREFNLVYTSL